MVIEASRAELPPYSFQGEAMRRWQPQTRRKQRAGAAAVELALVSPLFLLLLSGIIEFGQAFQIEHSLANAARRGARSAIVPSTTSAEITQQVKTHASRLLRVHESEISVAISLNGIEGAEILNAVESDEISVTVSIPFSRTGVGFYKKIFHGAILSSTSILERE